MRIYLAGPMRGYPRFNFDAFHEATVELRAQGYEVASPAEHDLECGFDPDDPDALDTFDLRAAIRWDIDQVMAADVVMVLEGWRQSEGCAVELAVARLLEIPVVMWRD